MDRNKPANDTKQSFAQIFTQGSEGTSTVPQRIGESASGLLKESFQRPSSSAVTGVLASINADNAKAGSSSNSTSTGESSLVFRSSSQYKEAALNQRESFRSDEKDGRFGRDHGQFAFDGFLAGPNDHAHESGFAVGGPALSRDQQSEFPRGTTEGDLPRVQEKETWRMQAGNQVFAHQKKDGTAVVALLSDPALMVDEEPSSILDLENDRGQGKRVNRARTGKGPAKPVDASHPSNSLDLMPDFGAPWNSSHASLATQRGIQRRGYLLQSNFGDVQPWINILDKYHDEVWGDMLPLIQEAREELKAANGNQTCLPDGPAIRRLRMILQQLRSPENI